MDNLIAALVNYGKNTGLVNPADRIYTINRLLEVLGKEDYCPEGDIPDMALPEILKGILDICCREGLCEDSVTYRDLFDTKLMGCLTPPPSAVTERFRSEYEKSPEAATEFYYKFSGDTN